jgi:predicted amidohydrolase YtcJ
MASVIEALQAGLSTRSSSSSSSSSTPEPLVGKGLFLGQWSDEDVSQIGKKALDPVFPSDLPVFVILNDLHSSFCNTAALKLLDYPLDHSGHFVEKEAFQAAVKLDAMDAHRMQSIIEEACLDAA